MSTSSEGAPGLWGLLPASLRTALVIALVTSLASAGLLFQTTGTTAGPSEIAGGEDLAPNGVALGGEASPTPTADGAINSRSEAVLSAPGEGSSDRQEDGVREGFPTLGRYIYAVDGYEEATAFGRRELPSEMTMTVDRTGPPDDVTVPPLASNEVFLDVFFSEDHTERAIAAYRDDGISFTYESLNATFGPVDQTTEARYDPAHLQIPAKLEDGAEVSGSSTATAGDGTQRRIDDWTVSVEGTEEIAVFGRKTETWVVKAERRSKPGSAERMTRTRTYWFDPSRAIWVRWEESLTSRQDVGPGDFIYTTKYTATLERAEPL